MKDIEFIKSNDDQMDDSQKYRNRISFSEYG